MKLIEKKLDNGIILTMPEQALPLINEIWEHQVYNRIYSIKENDIVFDVGANIGMFGLYAATKGAKVYCFEPNPDIFKLLQKNIRDNGLVERVIPYNMALGGENCFLELFIADTDRIYSAGSASTNRKYMADLGERIGADFKPYTVRCQTLDTVMNDLAVKTIDFMKIDCEGAEFDIIKSTSSQRIKGIGHMAMEIHGACYSQKDLCLMLMEKGFIIQHFQEVAGPFSVGYVYTTFLQETLQNTQIIASLDVKNPVDVNEGVVIDASGSFTTNGKDEFLHYRWQIDGQWLDTIDSCCKIEHRFHEPGMHRIVLEASVEGKTTSCQREIIVLKPDCSLEQVDYWLGENEADNKVSITSSSAFGIGGQNRQGNNQTDDLTIAIDKLTSFQGLFEPLCIEFNGQKTLIKEKYYEYTIKNIPSHMDVHFEICRLKEMPDPMDINIKWWINTKDRDHNDLEQGENAILEGNDDSKLPSSGVDALFSFMGKKSFSIGKELFPTTWVPKEVVIGVASARYRKRVNPLLGEVVYKDSSTPLVNFYTEYRFNGIKLNEDIEFSIELKKMSCIKIGWWCS